MKNLLCALGFVSSALIVGNSYSQNYVNVEEVKKEYRALDKPAKELPSILVYTHPTSIKFDSLDEVTKKRAWSILANHYEMQVEQYENKLKDYEDCQTKNANLEKEKVKLEQDKKFANDTLAKANKVLFENGWVKQKK